MIDVIVCLCELALEILADAPGWVIVVAVVLIVVGCIVLYSIYG